MPRGLYPRFTVAWGGAASLWKAGIRCGYKECEIGHPAWDDFYGRVLEIKRAGHTKPPKFTGRVI
jgi:hypothetical protein